MLGWQNPDSRGVLFICTTLQAAAMDQSASICAILMSRPWGCAPNSDPIHATGKSMPKFLRVDAALAVGLALGLSGCGGGGSNVRSDPPPGGGVPLTPENRMVVPSHATSTIGADEVVAKPILIMLGGELDNAGTVGGALDVAVTDYGFPSPSGGTVRNRDGGTIEGVAAAIEFHEGGNVRNEGEGSSIRSPHGNAIRMLGAAGYVQNTGGASITAGSTAIYLENGGRVDNGVGSTIETTGSDGGDCANGGACAIYAEAATNPFAAQSFYLFNAGTIIGDVQIAGNDADVTLEAGSSIHGDLVGARNLTLEGEAGTVQAYSQTVTGATATAATAITHATIVRVQGEGTWVLDNDALADVDIQIMSGGRTLRIGDGATSGSIGHGSILGSSESTIVFDRSDDVVLDASLGGESVAGSGTTFIKAGAAKLTMLVAGNSINLPNLIVEDGILQVGDWSIATENHSVVTGFYARSVVNNGMVVFNGPSFQSVGVGAMSGPGSVVQNGPTPVVLGGYGPLTYSGGTTINSGSLLAQDLVPGNVVVKPPGTLAGLSGATLQPGVPGVVGDLSNGGRVTVAGHDSTIGGNYSQEWTGTLAVSLGAKLDVAGTAVLDGGLLEVSGVEAGYVSNTHTEVLTAAGGVMGAFDQLTESNGVVFTATTINYDANSVWLDTTGLDVIYAGAGNGIGYTPASMGAAERVQGAFEQLNQMIATDSLDGVSGDFLHSAGQFQQAPSIEAAQASLRSLSGQLHTASAAMTFRAIDAGNQALSDRLDGLRDGSAAVGMWTRQLGGSGDMERSGFDGVGFQLKKLLVGRQRLPARSFRGGRLRVRPRDGQPAAAAWDRPR
jgi:fibronectin-binding autotransporter adhesin